MRKEFYGILPLALTSCLASQATAQEKQTQRPNVVFIYADDIGYGDLSCNGAKTIHTPNVERLAKWEYVYQCAQCGCYQYAFPLCDADRRICMA